MKELLLELLIRLEAIGKQHEQLKDPGSRDAMRRAVFGSFLRPKPGYELPDDYGLDSADANRAVAEALAAYIDAVREMAPAQGLTTFHQRLAAFQDSSISTMEGATFRTFFGYQPPESYDVNGKWAASKNADSREDLELARNHFYIGGFLTLIGVGVLAWQSAWILEILQGPIPITEAELVQMDKQTDLPESYRVFDSAEAIDTGWGIQKGDQLQSKYLLLRVQDRWILASVSPDHKGKRVVGYLKRIDAKDADFGARVLKGIRRELPDSQLTSLFFSASTNQKSEVWLFLGFVGFLTLAMGLLCLLGGVQMWRGSFDRAASTQQADVE